MASQQPAISRKVSMPDNNTIKIVIVGDGAVGKTSLLLAYSRGEPPADEYIPTVFDNYEKEAVFDGKPMRVKLWDTAGQEEYDNIRPLSYPETDLFLVCFSVDSLASVDNLRLKWVKEIAKHEPDTPFVVVGTKCDLRNEANIAERAAAGKPELRTPEDLAGFAKEHGGKLYMETSSRSMENVEALFAEALKLAISSREERAAKKAEAAKAAKLAAKSSTTRRASSAAVNKLDDSKDQVVEPSGGGCCVVS